MRVSVAKCRTADIFSDPRWGALMAEYVPECANPLLGAVAPQQSAYEALEALGVGQCFDARYNGTLCGFAFLLIGPLPHYGKRFATVESLFSEPDAHVGRLLMHAIEAYAEECGCEAILYSAPADGRTERLLTLLPEYRLTNHVFTRRLA